MTPDELTTLAMSDPERATAALESEHRAGTAGPAELYVLAQLRSRAGAADEALVLIADAEAGFVEAGDSLGAARCDAGRANVLADLGRHAEAVRAARRWLAWLHATDDDRHGNLTAQAHANLGVHLEDEGRYIEATQAHDAAIAIAQTLGDGAMAAEMQVNRANVLNLLGRSPEALAALEASAEILEAAGDTDRLSVVAINIGETLCRMGRPDDGLRWFERAEQLTRRGSADRAVLVVEIADALAALGALEAAELRYREAFAELAVTPLAWLAVRAWSGTGVVAAAQGRIADAEEAFAEASQLHWASGNRPGWAVTESEALALASAGATDRVQRLSALIAVVGELDAGRWPVQACRAHLNLARVRAGDPPAAESHVRNAFALAQHSGIPHLVVQAGHRLGELLIAGGRPGEAGHTLVQVLEVANRVRGRLHNDQLLRAFPATVAAAHDALVNVRIGEGRIADALALADTGRARAIIELGQRLRPATDRPEVHAVDDELVSIYDRLLNRDGSVDVTLRRQLDARAVELETRLERLRLDMGEGGHQERSADLPPSAQGEVEVVYHVTGGSIGAFVRDAVGTLSFHAGLATIDRVADDLERFHSLGRRSLAVGRSDHVVRLAEASEAVLGRLGLALLAPLAEHLPGARRLVVIPQGALHGVPFHALVLDGVSMLDRLEVVVAPSLAVRANRPPPSDGPTLLVGCGGPDLPGVDAELEALGALFPHATVLRDGDATVAAVVAAMAGAGCVHLASHGLFRAGAPMSSGIRLADGWLTARQTAALELDGALVVLSACDTGRSIVHAGDELLGMQRGFLLAGARAVVMSHWAAVDETVATTMAELHRRRLAGDGVPAALRAGWSAARRSHPHPWWWAPFFACSA